MYTCLCTVTDCVVHVVLQYVEVVHNYTVFRKKHPHFSSTLCLKKGSPTLSIVAWKDYQVLIIFGTNIPDTTGHQTTIQFPTSPNVCFCTTLNNFVESQKLWWLLLPHECVSKDHSQSKFNLPLSLLAACIPSLYDMWLRIQTLMSWTVSQVLHCFVIFIKLNFFATNHLCYVYCNYCIWHKPDALVVEVC